MKKLKITWQRLTTDSKTCPRCGSTEKELDKAVLILKKKLEARVTLEKAEIALDEFNKNPLESNRIFLNGKSLEELLDGTTGQSQCCSVCGDKNCRTLELNGKSHEVITADMIVGAGQKVLDI